MAVYAVVRVVCGPATAGYGIFEALPEFEQIRSTVPVRSETGASFPKKSNTEKARDVLRPPLAVPGRTSSEDFPSNIPIR